MHVELRRHQRARCQAEIPLIALRKIPEPLLHHDIAQRGPHHDIVGYQRASGTSSSRVVNSKIPYTLTRSSTLPCCPKPGSRPYHQATPLDETLYATLSTL